MRIHTPMALTLALVSVVACGGKDEEAQPPPPKLDNVLPNLPLPPGGQPLVTESGADATQFVVVSPLPPDSVVAYYRKLLSDPPFQLVSEAKTREGVAFYAEQQGPSLWVTVSRNADAGSQVVIAGAAKDTTLAKQLTIPGATRKPLTGKVVSP